MSETAENERRPPDSRRILGVGIGFFWLIFALLAQMLETQSASAQTRYPATRFRSYGFQPVDSFPTTPPIQKDSPRPATLNDFRSMSPDSWESPRSGFNSAVNPFRNSPAVNPNSKSIPWRPSQQPPNDLRGVPRSQPTVPGNLRLKDRDQQPPSSNDPFQKPTTNPAQGLEKFRPSSFPLSKQSEDQTVPRIPANATGNPWSATPSMPEDIRLPDSKEPETPANRGSVLEPSQRQLPVSQETLQTLSSLPTKPNAAGRYPLYPDQQSHDQRVTGLPPSNTPSPATMSMPNYRPDLGHREPNTVLRVGETLDDGHSFDFEKKNIEYPNLGEILKTGRYFGSATALYMKPAFQANTSLFLNQSGVTETFDFAYKLAPKIQLGFESKFGPGIELEYWGYSDFSRVASFTSDGVETATTSAWMRGANNWSRISAVNAGETLTARHRMELDVVGASFFKEVRLPKARINGKFGFLTAHIIHELTAQVTAAAGAEIGSLRNRSDVRGLGPQFELEYFRPIGHTKIEFLTSASGSVLFGKQSQVIENSNLGNQSRMKADEFVMNFDFFSGVQYRRMFGENRYWLAKTGVFYQAWLHGGTAVLPQDDFGLGGFAFSVGLNR